VSRRTVSRVVPGLALAATVALIAGCAGGTPSSPTDGGGGSDPETFSVLVTNENAQTPAMFDLLKSGACKADEEALPYELSQTPSADMQAKIQLLAGQDALPVLYSGAQEFIKPGGTLDAAGQVLNVGDALDELGVLDQVTPAAQSVIDQLYDGGFPTLPFQFNIEGIFYNKKIFADNDIEIPVTLDELTSAAEKLKAAGVTPFVASGKTGWTISRWVGAILFSELGPDAMAKIRDGEAKLTDPEYVAAAQKLQDMGDLFIEGITNLDYDTMNAQLLNGDAAMMYMGTWFLAQVNDESLNKVGADIGFMPFPGIDGYPANVGSPNAINKKLYGPKVGDWLKCLSENYGSVALETQGTFSGFVVNEPVSDLPPLTQEIQERIDAATSSVLWFEGLFPSKATTDASANSAPLLTGAMSAQDYMALLQSDIESAG
jgi:raffinose/stachyose/melibiose transport system substrate-binding protein